MPIGSSIFGSRVIGSPIVRGVKPCACGGATAALPSYTASGAGTTSVNGGYYLAGTYNGHNYYVNANGIYLYCGNSPKNQWDFSATLGGSIIYSGQLYSGPTGTYSVAGGGTAPAPTVVAGGGPT